jgi:hypothetical protein
MKGIRKKRYNEQAVSGGQRLKASKQWSGRRSKTLTVINKSGSQDRFTPLYASRSVYTRKGEAHAIYDQRKYFVGWKG